MRLVILLVLLPVHLVFAQGEDNIWFFGNRGVVDFNSGVPVVNRQNPKNRLIGGAGYYPNGFGIQAGISDSQGKLRFFVHYRSYGLNTDYRNISKVFDSSGYEMPHGNIDMRLTSRYSNQSPLIVPWPGHPDQYFIFYSRDGGLLYSIVDMRLNNGKGDVDTNFKDVLLSGYSTIHGQRLAAVKGCNGVWVLTKTFLTNGFNCYLVDQNGVNPNPVYSEGIKRTVYPNNDTQRIYKDLGRVVASNDGRRIAVATYTGIELYDFERCSGRLKNPMIIDTPVIHGLSFSPDNTKLYASALGEYDSSRLPFHSLPGRVYQYDLNLNDPDLMAMNRTLILESPRSACFDIFCRCGPPCFCDTMASVIGDLRLAADNKIYMLNNFRGCGLGSRGIPSYPSRPVNYTPSSTYNDSDFLFVIHEPNQLGWACRPEINYLNVTPIPRNDEMNRWLPLPLALPPPKVDTVAGKWISVAACFRDSMSLFANEEGACYYWDDGSEEQYRTVYEAGVYTVGYYATDCRYQIDTFHVSFPKLPELTGTAFSCWSTRDGKIKLVPALGDTTMFTYRWQDESGNLVGSTQSDTAFVIGNLAPGKYLLELTTQTGCDTSVEFSVTELPRPQAAFEADSLVCVHTPMVFNTGNREPYIQWHFGDGTTIKKERSPEHVYTDTGVYKVMLIAENIEGCRDTAIRRVQVKDLRLALTANKYIVNRGEEVQLVSSANHPYQAMAWQPELFFPEQSAYSQQIVVDTSRRFQVIGISELGCLDTAEVYIQTHPNVRMPTAFSPNGDGLNDYFRPHVTGGYLKIHTFQIFDRWGKMIWEWEESQSGWDGMYNGEPCEVGTYFYQIEGEEDKGRRFRSRGDFILMR